MFASLVGTLIIFLAVMLQTAVVSRLQLLNGTADLVLLVLTAWIIQEETEQPWTWALMSGGLVALATGLHWIVPISGYLIVGVIVWLLKRRVWQTPIIALFLSIFLGTIIIHLLSIGSLFIGGINLPLDTSFTLVILPSVLLNLLLAIPVFIVIRGFSNWVRPVEIEV